VRGSDGFAFVLHRDERGVSALGSSGIQLGYGGLTCSLAVQLCTKPSCAARRKLGRGAGRGAGSGAADEDDDVLCTLPEPHDNIFLVPRALSGKECICPLTGLPFVAPLLDETATSIPAPTHEDVDLSHHTDRISVQCAGVHANSTGPEASLASTALPPLDDGAIHRVRILLERDRLYDPRLPHIPAAEGAEEEVAARMGDSSYRLLVYVDNMHAALINIELDLRSVFGELEHWDGNMIAGFTAGTGKRTSAHVITSWSLHEISKKAKAKAGWWPTMGFS